MLGAAKKNLARLKRSPPGHRFLNKYNAAHRKGARTSPGARVLRIGLAVISFLVGVVFVFLPGPGIVFFALTGALLAPESRRLAVGLDWTELKLRAGLAWAKRTWEKLGWFGRSVVILVVAVLATAVGMAAWQRFFT